MEKGLTGDEEGIRLSHKLAKVCDELGHTSTPHPRDDAALRKGGSVTQGHTDPHPPDESLAFETRPCPLSEFRILKRDMEKHTVREELDFLDPTLGDSEHGDHVPFLDPAHFRKSDPIEMFFPLDLKFREPGIAENENGNPEDDGDPDPNLCLLWIHFRNSPLSFNFRSLNDFH